MKTRFQRKRHGGECEWKHKILYHIKYAAKVSLENTLHCIKCFCEQNLYTFLDYCGELEFGVPNSCFDPKAI